MVAKYERKLWSSISIMPSSQIKKVNVNLCLDLADQLCITQPVQRQFFVKLYLTAFCCCVGPCHMKIVKLIHQFISVVTDLWSNCCALLMVKYNEKRKCRCQPASAESGWHIGTSPPKKIWAYIDVLNCKPIFGFLAFLNISGCVLFF